MAAPGYGVALLTIVQSTDYDMSIRLAASINFKLLVRKHWDVVRAARCRHPGARPSPAAAG